VLSAEKEYKEYNGYSESLAVLEERYRK